MLIKIKCLLPLAQLSIEMSQIVERGGQIILITDGEDHESLPVRAARDAYREQGIRVFTVGIGDMGAGSRIPVTVNGQTRSLQHQGQEVLVQHVEGQQGRGRVARVGPQGELLRQQ